MQFKFVFTPTAKAGSFMASFTNTNKCWKCSFKSYSYLF